jgi:signal peptide peptidase SppA
MIDDLALRRLAVVLASSPLAMSAEAAAVSLMSLSTANLSALAALPSGAAPRRYDLDRGVATISVHGQTVDRATWLTDMLGFSSYRRVSAALWAAIADPDVRGIVLDFDSPGGDFSGAPELAAQVRQASARKPIVAHVDALAASAAYVIAAGAKHVVVTPSATVGSIGVVWLHLDHSAALAKSGVKPTILHAGAAKADGASVRPLSPEAEKRIRARINDSYEVLLKSFGAHRPKLGAAGARATEAAVYIGHKAVAAGLADAVGDRDLARSYLFSPPSSSAPAPSARPPSASSVQSLAAAPTVTASPSQSISEGAKPMTSAVLGLPALPPGHLYSADAMLKAAKREQRRAAANAAMARQLGAQSVEAIWDGLVAKDTASNGARRKPEPPATAKPAAAQAADDVWREALAASNVSSLRECYR